MDRRFQNTTASISNRRLKGYEDLEANICKIFKALLPALKVGNACREWKV